MGLDNSELIECHRPCGVSGDSHLTIRHRRDVALTDFSKEKRSRVRQAYEIIADVVALMGYSFAESCYCLPPRN